MPIARTYVSLKDIKLDANFNSVLENQVLLAKLIYDIRDDVEECLRRLAWRAEPKPPLGPKSELKTKDSADLSVSENQSKKELGHTTKKPEAEDLPEWIKPDSDEI